MLGDPENIVEPPNEDSRPRRRAVSVDGRRRRRSGTDGGRLRVVSTRASRARIAQGRKRRQEEEEGKESRDGTASATGAERDDGNGFDLRPGRPLEESDPYLFGGKSNRRRLPRSVLDEEVEEKTSVVLPAKQVLKASSRLYEEAQKREEKRRERIKQREMEESDEFFSPLRSIASMESGRRRDSDVFERLHREASARERKAAEAAVAMEVSSTIRSRSVSAPRARKTHERLYREADKLQKRRQELSSRQGERLHESPKPELSEKSRQLMAKIESRPLYEPNHFQRAEEREQRHAEEELEKCTFRPKIDPTHLPERKGIWYERFTKYQPPRGDQVLTHDSDPTATPPKPPTEEEKLEAAKRARETAQRLYREAATKRSRLESIRASIKREQERAIPFKPFLSPGTKEFIAQQREAEELFSGGMRSKAHDRLYDAEAAKQRRTQARERLRQREQSKLTEQHQKQEESHQRQREQKLRQEKVKQRQLLSEQRRESLAAAARKRLPKGVASYAAPTRDILTLEDERDRLEMAECTFEPETLERRRRRRRHHPPPPPTSSSRRNSVQSEVIASPWRVPISWIPPTTDDEEESDAESM